MNKDKKITISEVDSIIYKGINHVIIKLSNGFQAIPFVMLLTQLELEIHFVERHYPICVN